MEANPEETFPLSFLFLFFLKKNRQANKEISVDLQSISVDSAEKSRMKLEKRLGRQQREYGTARM
jgi:hypothetical protein